MAVGNPNDRVHVTYRPLQIDMQRMRISRQNLIDRCVCSQDSFADVREGIAPMPVATGVVMDSCVVFKSVATGI